MQNVDEQKAAKYPVVTRRLRVSLTAYQLISDQRHARKVEICFNPMVELA
jgi:hypothetical protein